MADKAKLNDMVDNLIDQKPENAQINFHDYLQTKMADIVNKSGDDESKNKNKED